MEVEEFEERLEDLTEEALDTIGVQDTLQILHRHSSGLINGLLTESTVEVE